MRIKMKTMAAGPQGTMQPGDETDVSDSVGQELVAGNYAADITPRTRPQAEFATAAPVSETAAVPKKARK